MAYGVQVTSNVERASRRTESPALTAALVVVRVRSLGVGALAADDDVIEILDSATYSATEATTLGNAQVKALTIRAAAGQRPWPIE